jgi:hypothetical protein
MSKRSAKRKAHATPLRPAILIAALLVLLVFAVFGRTVRDGFIYFDDDYYVTQNVIVQKGLTMDGLAWALTTADYFYWHPVTWLSHMMDCELYGLWPGGHHFTNVAIHALTAVLVFAALFAMTGALWRSAWWRHCSPSIHCASSRSRGWPSARIFWRDFSGSVASWRTHFTYGGPRGNGTRWWPPVLRWD